MRMNGWRVITSLGEPKVEALAALEVDYLPQVGTLQEEMVLVILVLLSIVMGPIHHALIPETS